MASSHVDSTQAHRVQAARPRRRGWAEATLELRWKCWRAAPALHQCECRSLSPSAPPGVDRAAPAERDRDRCDADRRGHQDRPDRHLVRHVRRPVRRARHRRSRVRRLRAGRVRRRRRDLRPDRHARRRDRAADRHALRADGRRASRAGAPARRRAVRDAGRPRPPRSPRPCGRAAAGSARGGRARPRLCSRSEVAPGWRQSARSKCASAGSQRERLSSKRPRSYQKCTSLAAAFSPDTKR